MNGQNGSHIIKICFGHSIVDERLEWEEVELPQSSGQAKPQISLVLSLSRIFVSCCHSLSFPIAGSVSRRTLRNLLTSEPSHAVGSAGGRPAATMRLQELLEPPFSRVQSNLAYHLFSLSTSKQQQQGGRWHVLCHRKGTMTVGAASVESLPPWGPTTTTSSPSPPPPTASS
jgi:hypothetical protein